MMIPTAPIYKMHKVRGRRMIMRQEELRQLLEDMSLEEKIGQMVQLSADFYKGDAKSVIT